MPQPLASQHRSQITGGQRVQAALSLKERAQSPSHTPLGHVCQAVGNFLGLAIGSVPVSTVPHRTSNFPLLSLQDGKMWN